MESNKQPLLKQMLLFFGLPFISTLLATAVYEHLITPALPFLPKVPFILYRIFVTAFVVFFLLGLVGAIWNLLVTGWKNLTRKELRDRPSRKNRTMAHKQVGHTPCDSYDILCGNVVANGGSTTRASRGTASGYYLAGRVCEHLPSCVYSNVPHFFRHDGSIGI